MFGMIRSLVNAVRAHPAFNRLVRDELARDRGGRHPVDPRTLPHLLAALEWLGRAQDASASGGVSRGYSLGWNPYFRRSGWQPPYPETTGYIIPTWLEAAVELADPAWRGRAIRAAQWECELQLETGAVQGGVVGEGRSPAVFNTGQVMLGWLAAWEQTNDDRFARAAERAGWWLADVQGPDGLWQKGNSRFALSGATLYNARVAWALAEVGVALGVPAFLEAARRNLLAVAGRVAPNGWIPDCCLSDPNAPLLHTLAYAVRGLVEGGRVLEDEFVFEAGARTARALLHSVDADGKMAGRFAPTWQSAVSWSCLTGQAQIASNWMRLFVITGDRHWLTHVPTVLTFLKSTQNRTSASPGLRGGIKGSWPLDGQYGRFEVLNWATKYFADALLRWQQIETGRAFERARAYRLA